MDLQSQVDFELRKVHQLKSRIGYIPTFFLLLGSIIYFNDHQVLDIYFILGVTFLFLGTTLRILVNEFVFQHWLQKKFWAIFLSYFSFILIGLAWSIHFYDVLLHFGPSSMQAMYTLLTIGAFATGASTTLQSQSLLFYVYLFTLCTGTLMSYLFFQGPSYIAWNIIFFTLFSLAQYTVSHRQLKNLVLTQIQMNIETDKLKNFIDTAPGFVCLISKDHICYLANQITRDLYPQIIGTTIGSLDPTSQWEKFVIDFIDSDKVYDVGEHFSSFNGNDIYVLMRVRKLDDGGVIVVSLPINELVEAKRQIRVQEAKAIYASKLASLGEMAAGIAHEVNNPLTIIQGSANVIRKLVEADPINRETLRLLSSKLIDTTNRISKTIRSLKSLSRNGETDPMEEVSISQVIEICFDLSRQHLINNKIEFRLPEKIPQLKVLGREVQLSQVLINLLNNAVDAVKDQKTRWIELRVEEIDSIAHVYIIDSGPGIPYNIHEKIMEPFFTTKDVNQGTGLGLSISKAIMTDHGGDIALISERPDTTFRLRLPLIS
jgi:signal transduction histidine kinase